MIWRRSSRLLLLEAVQNHQEQSRSHQQPNQTRNNCLFGFKLDAHHYGQLLTNKTRYFYRSEQSFINFKKNYYQILGVQPETELHIIKQRFYHLAKECHPDRNQGNSSQFKEINQAYNVLSQPHLRKQYDSNRLKQFDQQENQDSLGDDASKRQTLNYEPYSQMNRAEWARLRNGFVKLSTVDYTNYKKTFEQQKDRDVQKKENEQWERAFRGLKVQQVNQQIQFRNKLNKKYMQDRAAARRAKEQFIQQRFSQIGNKIQRVLGKTVRSVFDRLIKKQ